MTFHPTTLELDRTEVDVAALLNALAQAGHPVIFTAPNADPAGRVTRGLIKQFVESRANAWFVENLGTEGYFNCCTMFAR